MLTKEIIRDKYLKENPGFPKALVNVHAKEKDGKVNFYLGICNAVGSDSVMNDAQIEEIKKSVEAGEKVINAFANAFSKNQNVLEAISAFYDDNNNDFEAGSSVEKFAEFISKKMPKEKTGGKIYENNNFQAFKVLENGDLGELVFKMDFNCEKFGSGDYQSKRFKINSAESFDRGNGIYKNLLTKYLPKLARKCSVTAIVLEASAFDTNSAEKGGQQKLEEFYKNCGLTKVLESERADFPGVLSQDYDHSNNPIYYAPVLSLTNEL